MGQHHNMAFFLKFRLCKNLLWHLWKVLYRQYRQCRGKTKAIVTKMGLLTTHAPNLRSFGRVVYEIQQEKYLRAHPARRPPTRSEGVSLASS